jgi:hypothetical protein
MPRKEQAVEMVKCSLKLPRAVWRESKIRALDTDRDWQSLVAEAIQFYLDRVPLSRGGDQHES